MTDFHALLERLQKAGVEFIVVGGAAATAHGSARLTLLDVVYRRTLENIRRVVVALAESNPFQRGALPGLPFVWDERTILRGLNFTLITSLGAIDLLGEIAGGGYDELLPHTIALEPFGVPCRALSLVKLIEVKRAAGRPKDIEAIAELETILEQQRS